jgi:aldehyde:ferredoxin oxidoreductase
MSNIGGYAGKTLKIDLSGETIVTEDLDKDLAENYIGGRGFTSKLQQDLIPPDANPLGPENVLIIATGPLTGTMAPASSRFVVGGKSPLTGILGDANCGGFWGPELKMAGYDMLTVYGRAEHLVYIWIDDDQVEIRSAEYLRNKDTQQTEKMIREELGDESIQVACIGPAGENMVRFAGVVANIHHLAARTGMGAVMGSKNLKAIAVRGTVGLTFADPEKFKQVNEQLWDIIVGDPKSGKLLPEYGTTTLIKLHNEMGGMSTRNWQTGYFDASDKIDGDAINRQYLTNAVGCYACPSRCDRYCVVTEGEFKGTSVGGPEYYTIVSFGSKLGNDNLASILKANELCNLYGLDTGSTGGIIAFAMECYEKGLITKEDTGGLELTWGNYRVMLELIEQIAYSKGFGKLLGQGFREAVKQIGPESEAFAIHVKGMDLSTFDPRALQVYNFRYAVASRGADHLRISAHGAYELENSPPQEAVTKLKYWQDVVCIPDMMGICKFPYTFFSESTEVTLRKALELVPELYAAATGIEMNGDKLMEASWRTAVVERLVNNGYGMTIDDDCLPKRFTDEPMPDGPSQGKKYDIFNLLKETFYEVSGWDKAGQPTEETLEKLKLK